MFGHENQLPIEVIYGGGPAPGERHSDYVGHLWQWIEDAYNVVRENVHGARNIRSSIMTIKLWVGTTVSVIRCGSIVQQFRKGIQLNSINNERAPLRSDVTYCIKDTSAMGSQGCRWRKRLVVHFNHLKPCSAGVPLTNESETRPEVQRNPPAGQEFNDKQEATLRDIVILSGTDQCLSSPEEMPVDSDSDSGLVPSRSFLTENSCDQDVPAEVPKETARGGPIWSYRLRRMTKPPHYYRPVDSFPQRRE